MSAIFSSDDGPASTLAVWSGWGAVAFFAVAAAIPVVHRLVRGRRADPASRPMRTHVVIGLTTTLAALAHTVLVLPSLGSAAVITGGNLALAPGAFAFLALIAHVGVGLRLRAPRLRDRARQRRRHALIATAIAIAVAAHISVLACDGHASARAARPTDGPADARSSRTRAALFTIVRQLLGHEAACPSNPPAAAGRQVSARRPIIGAHGA